MDADNYTLRPCGTDFSIAAIMARHGQERERRRRRASTDANALGKFNLYTYTYLLLLTISAGEFDCFFLYQNG